MAETSTSRELRAKRLQGLRNNAGQSSSWQTQLLDEIEEMKRDNQLLRQGYAMLKQEIEALKQERATV